MPASVASSFAQACQAQASLSADGFRTSVEDQEFAETRWSDALSSGGKTPSWGGVRFGNRLVDSRTLGVSASPAAAFALIRRIGGANGWYFANVLLSPIVV